MKKRILAALAALVFVLSCLYGCGKTPDTDPQEPAGQDTPGSSQESTPEVSNEETPAPSESDSEAPPESDTAPPEKVYAVTTSRVNFRSGPDISYDSYGVLDAGVTVEIAEKGEWARVLHNGQEGYIYSEYLNYNASGSVQPPETRDPETPPAESSTVPRETLPYDPNGGILTENGLFKDVASLPNQSIPYGNDWDDKDESGMPNGIYWYENVYGKYYPVYRINTNGEKLLYLTMDEGYEAGFTPRILDTLKEKNVKCVFFLTKQFYDSNPELIQRMIDEGHILGNHTCLHPAGGYPNYVAEHGIQSFIDDVSTLHKLIYDRFGYSMRLFRFPEGESSEMLMAELCNLGYTSVFWSYAHRDYVLDDQPPAEVTLDRCLSHMAPGAVYLLHAVSESNTNALAAFIDGARAAGFEFGTFPVEEVLKR